MFDVSSRQTRRGIATVEAAVALPVVVLLLFGFVEIGYYVNCHHVLHDAARQGARAAVHLENSNDEVRAAVLSSLNHSFNINPGAVTVRLSKLDSTGAEEYQVMNLNHNEQGEAVRVKVTIDYAQFHPPSNYIGLSGQQLTSAVVMQRQKN